MKNLSPFQKEIEIHDRLLKFLKQQKKGLTTTDISSLTGIARKTLEKHLQLLTSKNEITMKQYGPSRVYQAAIKTPLEKKALENILINFELIETEEGKLLLIQESAKKDNAWHVKGSVTIPLTNTRDFAAALNKALSKIKNL